MRRWFVLAANVYVQFIIYGIVASFGVFLPEISSSYNSGKGETAWIGSLSAGSMQLSGPIAAVLTERYGPRLIMCIGAVFGTLSLLASVFTSNVFTMYFTYGFFLGFGCGLMTVAGVISVTQQFQNGRSLALGVVYTGGSMGMSAFPMFVTVLFGEYGWKMTLLILSGLVMNIIVCGAILQSVKTQSKTEITESKPQTLSLVRNKGFTCYVLSAFLNNMGYYIPLFLLPDYALTLGLTNTKASSLLTVQGITSILGRIFVGYIGDKESVSVPLINAVLPLIDGVLIAMLQIGTSLLPLMFLSAGHGIFSAPFSSMVAVSLLEVVGMPNLATAYGVWLFMCGLGSLLGPPVAGWIYDFTGSYVIGFYISAIITVVSGLVILWIPLRCSSTVPCKKRKCKRVQNVFSIHELN